MFDNNGQYAAYVLTDNGLIPVNESELGSMLFGASEEIDEVESTIDLDDAWIRFLTGDFDLSKPGVTAVIALKIYQTREPVEGVHPMAQLAATETLEEVLNMTEACCSNPWCARTALFELVGRYDLQFGTPQWVLDARAA